MFCSLLFLFLKGRCFLYIFYEHVLFNTTAVYILIFFSFTLLSSLLLVKLYKKEHRIIFTNTVPSDAMVIQNNNITNSYNIKQYSFCTFLWDVKWASTLPWNDAKKCHNNLSLLQYNVQVILCSLCNFNSFQMYIDRYLYI